MPEQNTVGQSVARAIPGQTPKPPQNGAKKSRKEPNELSAVQLNNTRNLDNVFDGIVRQIEAIFPATKERYTDINKLRELQENLVLKVQYEL